MGRNTLGLASNSDTIQLIEDYSQKRLDFLRSLDGWRTFGNGWANRVTDVELEAKQIWSSHA
jgi:lysozyme family protein